jgi:predicted DCC family thiol-disulfide oxidoreductase YuxK
MDHPIVLFDGVCNLCNREVQFIIKRDKKKQFLFTPLQSKAAQVLLEKFNLPTSNFDSFVLVENGKIYLKSTAVLRIARRLGFGWSLLYVFIIVPPFARNAVYDLVARNRYKWFGKKETCMVPTADLKQRFLE